MTNKRVLILAVSALTAFFAADYSVTRAQTSSQNAPESQGNPAPAETGEAPGAEAQPASEPQSSAPAETEIGASAVEAANEDDETAADGAGSAVSASENASGTQTEPQDGDAAGNAAGGTDEPAASVEAPVPAIDPKDVTLNIATWSGAYGQSQERAFITPFADQTGYQVSTVFYNGDYEAFIEQGDQPEWNLVDMNASDLVRACNDDRLERLDAALLDGDGASSAAADDFLPGAVHDCGIASMAWSAVLVADTRLENAPALLKDFFDIGAFPGKRILPKQPQYSLEIALLADGVPVSEVYDVLSTAAGQDRAFAKLSSIKDDIIWWEDPSNVLGRIVNGEAIMGLAFNGRAFMAIAASEHPLRIVWDHQIYTYDFWAIPRNAEFQDQAREFIAFSTTPESLAAQARWLPYGPARRSATALVGKHPELGIDMQPFLPTHEANFAKALQLDSVFWAENNDALAARFDEWVTGRQLPPQKNALNLE